MSAISGPIPRASRATPHGKHEVFVGMFIVWLMLEYGRPPNPMKIPLMISLVFLVSWLLHSAKRWNPQIVMMMLFVAQMTLIIPFTENNYAARMVTREVFIVIVCIAVPMAHFMDSLKRFDTVLRCWIVIFVYMAIIALMNGGNGPGGASHGVDENYTALFMTMAVSLAYFSAFTTRNPLLRVATYGLCGLFVAAIVVGMSRGGFVGLVGVVAICWWNTPRRFLALLGGAFAVLLFLALVPESYLLEVQTIGDTSESTADARIQLWKLAVQIYLDNPIVGVGPGNYRWVAEIYKANADSTLSAGMHLTHSLYFELLSEMGTTGVLLWGGIVYLDFRDCRRVGKLARVGRQRFQKASRGQANRAQRESVERLARAEFWAKGLQSALVGFLLCSLFLSTLYYTTFWLLTALVLALLEATRREVTLLWESLPVGPPGAPVTVVAPPDPATEGPAALSGLLGR